MGSRMSVSESDSDVRYNIHQDSSPQNEADFFICKCLELNKLGVASGL